MRSLKCIGQGVLNLQCDIRKIAIDKNLIIPTEDVRPTSFGPNDIDNIDQVAEIHFGLLSKKAKR
jgi:hypothetical protein